MTVYRGPGGSSDVVINGGALSGRLASFYDSTGSIIEDSGFSGTDFATATQGGKADTAIQPSDIGNTVQGYSGELQAIGAISATVGLLKKTATNTWALVTDGSTNWNTAYGWGNHASAGYALTSSLGTIASQNAASVAISGGALNSTTVGVSTPAAGKFTTLQSTGSIGYTGTGTGGSVTQGSSKSTTVVLDKICGEIVLNAASLAAATVVSFTFTNATIAATDVLVINHVTTGTKGGYTLNAECLAGSATISVRNNTAGALAEAIVLRYAVIKAVTA